MFKCPLTNKSNSAAIKSTLEIASMQSSYVTQNSGVRISISSRVRHLFIGLTTASACERLGSGLPSACERLGSKELSVVHNPKCDIAVYMSSILCYTWYN